MTDLAGSRMCVGCVGHSRELTTLVIASRSTNQTYPGAFSFFMKLAGEAETKRDRLEVVRRKFVGPASMGMSRRTTTTFHRKLRLQVARQTSNTTTCSMAVDTSTNRCSPPLVERPPKPKPANPIEAAIKIWLQQLPLDLLESITLSLEHMIESTPKRWVVYAPMVLLPSGSFGDDWWKSLGSKQVTSEHQQSLWSLMLDKIGKREGKGTLTHLAINSGIPLHKTEVEEAPSPPRSVSPIQDAENILRTPSGLITLYGSFGPSLPPTQTPTEKDFERAFWVSTKQNGITQTWAPRYTMFSRGNIKEKARLLDFHSPQSSRALSKKVLAETTAVDLYAGIGYFVFSYVRSGTGKVFGWELNPWSVEALRRGAVMNGWSVKVVSEYDATPEIADENMIVFSEDNRKATQRMRDFGEGGLGKVRHVNCGLLPTSEGSWETALRVLRGEGWIHVHENVGVDDVEMKSMEIEKRFRRWMEEANDARGANVEHVEFVKTFAPGVWHCVFDVYIHLVKEENSR